MCFFLSSAKRTYHLANTPCVVCVCNNGLVRHAMSGCMEFFFRAAFACLQMQENTWMTSSSGTVWFHGSSQRWSEARWRAAREPHCNRNYVFKNIFKNGLVRHAMSGCMELFFGPHLHVCKCRRTNEWHHLQELSGSMVLHSVEARHTGVQLKKPHCNRNYSFTNIFKNIFKIVFKILQDLCSAFYLAGMS